MSHRVLAAADAYWRPSNQMGVANTDLAKQLGARTVGARMWRLAPGQASTRHRHADQAELYVLLEGTFHGAPGGHFGMWSGTIDSLTRIEAWGTAPESATTAQPR